ncbi:hypothetical protein ElyMa_006483900 [Elysia marginata]|uniref:Uncharacterized protein n=1 Tax=Elysia marginata TaxID=1093978 RepID=A0AAV4I4R3_9GAST|nr:hypothetical protein ElyMa_006483900 [Elysia marginata]
MKLELFMFALALSGSLALTIHHSGGWEGGMVISRRDAESTADADVAEAAAAADDDGDDDDDDDEEVPTQAELGELVQALLDGAKEGMKVNDMAAATVTIQAAADAIVDAEGGKVDAEEVEKVIDDAAASFSGAVAVSSLFDDPLTYEASKMDAALCLINSLNKKTQEQEGDSSQVTVAAISMTAKAMQNILADTVGIIAFNIEENKEEKDVNKRLKFEGHWNRDPSGGHSVGAKISHKWGGRRKRSITRSKRGEWEASASVNRDSDGGSSVGATVSYAWRR